MLLWKYILALVIGIVVGYKTIPAGFVAVVYLLLCAIAILNAAQTNLKNLFTVLPFAIYTEIFIRGFARWVPYLTMQYVLIICFTLLLIQGRNNRSHFKGYFLLILFVGLELVNNIQPDQPQIGRALLINSLSLLMLAWWASLNVLKPRDIQKLLSNIKIATIFLTGVVLVSHLQGKINYGTISNADASNGMAPVQLSGYLGTGCILFFLSIMNPEEAKSRLMNIILLAFAATIMVLTFSRGGIYFVAAIVALYLYYNKQQFTSYLRFIFLLPVALFIQNYVVDQTGGKIVERYGQEGASSREVLVSVGFELFLRNPFTGVGTGNYNTRIVTEHLFPVESGAHNEFVRAGAEHGILGIAFYWGFFIFLFTRILKRRQPEQQYAMYFLALFCLITVHNGLKISLQPLLLMLALAITPPLTIKKTERDFATKELPQGELV